MKKLNLISLEKDVLKNEQMQSVKGGGICACSHQGCRRSMGQRRGAIKDKVDILFTPAS